MLTTPPLGVVCRPLDRSSSLATSSSTRTFSHRTCTGWAKKVGPLRLKTHNFCLHIQNVSINFYDFRHTSTPFYSEYIF